MHIGVSAIIASASRKKQETKEQAMPHEALTEEYSCSSLAVYKKMGLLHEELIGWVCDLKLEDETFEITEEPMKADVYWHEYDSTCGNDYDSYVYERVCKMAEAKGYTIVLEKDKYYGSKTIAGKKAAAEARERLHQKKIQISSTRKANSF